MARYNTDNWENIKQKLATARAEQAPEDSPEERQKRMERVREWERQRRSDAAKKAAITRKDNARIEAEVMAEIAKDEAENGPAIPKASKAERDRRCKSLLRDASGLPPLGPDGQRVNYGSSRMTLPKDKWKAFQRIRKNNEPLVDFVIRMVDEEMIRQLEAELRQALGGQE